MKGKVRIESNAYQPIHKLGDNPERRQKRDEELRLLYSMSASEIAAFKQQQWQVTNYALLIFAAIYFVAQHLWDTAVGSQNTILVRSAVIILLIILVAAASLWTTVTLSQSIMARRQRHGRIRTYFEIEFHSARNVPKPADFVPCFLCGAQILGAGVTLWLVFTPR